MFINVSLCSISIAYAFCPSLSGGSAGQPSGGRTQQTALIDDDRYRAVHTALFERHGRGSPLATIDGIKIMRLSPVIVD